MPATRIHREPPGSRWRPGARVGEGAAAAGHARYRPRCPGVLFAYLAARVRCPLVLRVVWSPRDAVRILRRRAASPRSAHPLPKARLAPAMYRHCMFCSADLGRNDAFETFPAGQRIAFDARKGRLWAVCPRCARWNLAPLEERWEVVEAAERLFRDARLRVQSENVGLAHLGDRTQLVRIGEALPGELAAWRYGRELRRRRVGYWWRTAGLVALGDVGLLLLLARREKRSGVILHRLSPEDSPTGAEVHIHARHLRGARLDGGDGAGGVRLVLPRTAARLPDTPSIRYAPGPSVTLEGAAARAVLSRALVQVNRRGAPPKKLHQALDLLSGAGSAEACIARFGDTAIAGEAAPGSRFLLGRLLVDRGAAAAPAHPARGVAALALEMALHEEAERRALEGELSALEASWQEAEEIAAIADALPDGPAKRG